MASAHFARSVAVRSLPLVVASSWSLQQPSGASRCEKPTFQEAKCTSNVVHTHDTRLVTLQLPSNWNDKGAVANVVVRAEIEGVAPDSGCCACCKCAPGPCSCPKTPTGCCACCSCEGTCGCAKVVPSATSVASSGCCACCKCAPGPCSCPKTETGCCACCGCKGTCGCAKVVPSATDTGDSSKTLVARPYNPLSATSGDTVTLLVKRYGPSAQMGSKLHLLNEGDSIEVKGPNKQWTIPEPGKVKQYTMIAGGTGITPIIQATEAILENDKDARVSLYSFNKTPNDILLSMELFQIMMKHPSRFVHRPFVASTGEVKAFKALPFEFQGTPTMDVLEKVLPKPTDHDGKVMVCVCGRPEMLAAVAGPKTKDYKQGELGGVLKELGFSKEQVRKF